MIGYGLVGLGGNLGFVCSLPFSELFANVGVASSIICGGFQAAGFIFMLLAIVPFVIFFRIYAGMTLIAFFVVFLTYPDHIFEDQDEELRWGVRFSDLPCIRSRR